MNKPSKRCNNSLVNCSKGLICGYCKWHEDLEKLLERRRKEAEKARNDE